MAELTGAADSEPTWKEDWPAKLALVLLTGLLLYSTVPSFLKSANRGPYMSCRSQLRLLSDSLDRHRDKYHRAPKKLADLVPDFLPHLPRCPRAETSDYHYTAAEKDGQFEYRLSCPGQHRYLGPIDVFSHIGAGYPQYLSNKGFVDH